MKKLLISLLLSVALVTSAKADFNTLIDQTNFTVGTGCSGTLIAPNLVLTAYHCAQDLVETVDRETLDGDKVKTEKVRKYGTGTVSQQEYKGAVVVKTVVYTTKVEAVDSDNDLALLRIEAAIPNTVVAPLSCTDPRRGDDITIVGNPMGTLYSSVTKGVVSSVQRTRSTLGFEGSTMLLQVSGGVVGGNSGGSVYNDKHELIGVPVLAHRANEVLGFAVPLSVIRSFLKDKVPACG